MQTWPVLSTILWWPTVGALVIGLIRWLEVLRGKAWPRDLYRQVALFFSGTNFLMGLPVVVFFHTGYSGLQFEERVLWIPEWGISYALGVDGLNILLVGLTALLVPIAVLSAWQEVREHVAGFYAALLFLETALLGVFLAVDLLMFYVFWELVLVPMFFIIFVWGGPRRVYAAFKFLLYTFAGSLFLLAGIVYLYVRTGGSSLLYGDVLQVLQTTHPLSFREEVFLFLAFAIAFAVKVPVVPFHMWLPAAHVEAPTPGSVLLAGVLLKMGTYGLLRLCVPLFPQATSQFQAWMVALGVLGIVYGAWAALAQTDMKRLVAYSSISHLGLIVAGIFALEPTAVQGAILQMVNHGISTGGLFVLVGLLYERRHTREMDAYGGLAH
ncbi:MAG: NADH-quinone oxidoreductase subunit M, partial [Acidobacteria bacterium]|nr:NADH-quinone oxidoreductase subunit M [Acidobacteriota bacterium]MDW7984403.1 NADH-quinone oxidoreductase subunit M [Acidobacteriota bacterium]